MKEALQMMTEQTENKWLKKGIAEVLTNVEKGNTLADSMSALPDIFPAMLVNMVQAGESSGSLDTSFERMAIHFEKEAQAQGNDPKSNNLSYHTDMCSHRGNRRNAALCHPDFYRHVCRSGCGDAGTDNGSYECQQMDGRPLVYYLAGDCCCDRGIQTDLPNRAGKTEDRLYQDEDAALWQAYSQNSLRKVCKNHEHSDGIRYIHTGMP